MPYAALLSLLATLLLSVFAAVSSPRAAAQPGPSAPALDPTPVQTPTINPTYVPKPPLKCLMKATTSYCIPNTTKYQVCASPYKQIQCPIDSYCKETTDKQGNTMAYCKYIG